MRLLIIALLTTLATLNSFADGLDDYYVVELTIFTNENPEYLNEETWPKNISLSYPGHLAYLTNKRIETIYPGLSTLIKEAAKSGKNLESVTPEEASADDLLMEQPLLDERESNNTDILSESDTHTDIDLPPVFFPLLDKSYQGHKEAIAKINWSKKYNIVFTETWLQKIENKENAPNIVIQAGDIKSNIHQLAGTIKIFKERYLHLNTNLWLVHFSADNETTKDGADVTAASTIADADTAATTDLPIIEEPWPIPPTLIIPDFSETPTSPQAIAANSPIANDETNEELTKEKNKLPVERITIMQQKRKMRSREVHYLDHPLFGLMIEIRPYIPPVKK